MLNFKFIKAQFNFIWVILLIFALVLTLLLVPEMTNWSVGPNFVETVCSNSSGGTWGIGASGFFDIFFYGKIFPINFFGLIFLVFGIAMSGILINREVSRGYVTSWLTTPISRASIFNSKLFLVATSTLVLNLWLVLMEMVVFSIRMVDFQATVGHVLLGNLALFCFSMLIVSICWIVYAIFRKNGVAIAILLGLGGWIILCSILESLSSTPELNLENLKYFKYVNLQSLLNSPFKFEVLSKSLVSPVADECTVTKGVAKVLPIEVLDFAWQLPVMFVVTVGCLTGAQFIIKNKDFAF